MLFAATSAFGQATLTINGISDRTKYDNSVTLSVPSTAGYTYEVLLNGKQLATDANHVVNVMDYYELSVTRTNTSTLDVTNRVIRFIVQSSRRGDPERGLLEWSPYPPIPSTSAEFAGAQLKLVTPSVYPQDLDVPVAAWVENPNGSIRRGNGWVSAPGFESSAFRILRGHGHGFLPPQTTSGNLNYNAQLAGLQATKQIAIESSTTWSNVSGTLSGAVIWPADSRIYVTSSLLITGNTTLTIEQGAIVKLNPLVNITVTNGGKVKINGTLNQPVVLTATNRVAPEVHTGAWGGFIIRNNGELIANGAIMTGSGGNPSFSFSPGASHRSEQALLLVHTGSRAFLTNCFLINVAGQIGNGYNSDVTYDNCLLQRAITAGEYEGGTVIVNRSAIIEFPSVDGIYDADIVDSDYDAIYFTTGVHIMQDSLFGFCKDDAIDSGSGGAGTVLVTNCWIESATHEALAWSGGGRQTWTYDSVLMNSGQGLECGWSTGTNSPLVFGERVLSTANCIGTRYGDNYTGTSGLGLKSGELRVTNSFLIYNYRDVFGRPWDDTWNWRTNDMWIISNALTAPVSYHPSNTVWNPSVDAPRLAPFMATPPNAPVGIGIATWDPGITIPVLTNGVPIRLSTFTTNVVSVAYALETSDQMLTNGTLTFQPGETLKTLVFAPNVPPGKLLRVALSNPVNGEITGTQYSYLLPAGGNGSTQAVSLIARGAVWKYYDKGVDLGTDWRNPAYNDTVWSSGPAQLGFGDGDEATVVNGGPSGARFPTTYYRHTFQVADPDTFVSLPMWMLRDDGGVVYVNGTEVFRSSSLPAAPAAITYNTYANALGSAPGDNSIDRATLNAGLLVPGNNVVAVEIHQFDPPSSDSSFDFELLGNPTPAPPRMYFQRFSDDLVIYWYAAGAILEEADQITGPWHVAPSDNGVATVPVTGNQKFYRLR